MACDFEILFPASARERMMAVHEALDEIGRLERQMTVYRDDSEISRINRDAATRSVPMEPALFELLRQAVELSRRTEGAFDVAAGALSRCWGFDRRQGRLPAASEIDVALRRVGSRHLLLDEADCAVRFARPLEINLGAIGKGHALDRAAEIARRGGVQDALLHAGFSSFLAVGSAPSGEGWPVGVRDPLRHDRDLAVLNLRDRALSTSGSGQQHFFCGGRRFGHVIDPRTGWPGEGSLLAAAVAPTAAQADALSTAFHVMKPREVEDYCLRWPEVGALLLERREGVEALRIRAFGLDDCLLEVPC